MNRVSLCRILCVAVLYSLTVHAFAAEANGVSFEPSPGADWQCTLTNDDLPGLAAEGMTRPIASGCARGSARAYVVIVDLSSSRSAMSADQMAADAEEQLPSNWKIESKQYEVLTLENGRDAAYSKLTGKGDGFTFATGNSAMVSISANVPLLFEDNQSAAHQAIAVFRIRAPLPAQGRKTLIAELDQTLRQWAATAHPTGKPISDRAFEAASYARNRAGSPPAAAAAAPVATSTPRQTPAPESNERFAAALAASSTGAASDHLASLQEMSTRFRNTALGALAETHLVRAEQAQRVKQELAILTTSMNADPATASQVLSEFVAAAMNTHDAAGLAGALNIARVRGWTVQNLTPDAQTSVARGIAAKELSLPADSRAFFEIPTATLLQLAQSTRAVPSIGDVAKPNRDTWRMKSRTQATAFLVRNEEGIGLLSRDANSDTYRYRALTNLLDLPPSE